MATLKGKEKLEVALEYSIKITLDRTIFTELLQTPKPFSIDI